MLEKGKNIALVGESGSGKSTFMAILRGLYQADKGKLIADGKKLEHGLAHLAEYVTLIPQEPEIFDSTVEDNVTMGLKVSKEVLLEAVELAQFKPVVKRLKKGLKTNVMEKGVSLSGGEKQRLALARGILAAKDSDIILLDEPTSSVDSDNEMAIHTNIFDKFSDRTVISSIHRLHLLDKFDYIYFFKNGKIIAEGNLRMLKEQAEFRVLWEKYQS